MRSVLVTGAAGFVGAALARRVVVAGHEVHVVIANDGDAWRLDGIKKDVRLHIADLRDRDRVGEVVREARPDWVFHLAAHGAYPTQTDRGRMILTNVLGTSVLLDAAVGRGFDAFVYAGSSSEYGIKDHAPNEDESLSPNSDYAVTKAAATMLCANVGRTLGLNVATLRLYSVYGPWEEPTRFVPALAVYGLAGRLPPLASPTTARDFVYIDDVVEAFLAAATVRSPDPGGIYNIGAGKQVTLGEAVDAAKRLFRIEATPDWGGHAGRSWDASVWVSNPTRAYRILGWKAIRSFESGLAAFVDWLQADEMRLRRYRAAVATDEASGQT